ncbi:hypothetical protein TTHERM_00324380 (macronuclear) [Tetrahymena thermophila SB210]|uniref:Uncharacterized protein n=1 Tax=Tetrahymena thermophila (strain SB210) TaxID=312017 RepID=Q237G0_TETTS|nr:hypothetical protein TTHERM_00324380 [Tetrahymena thermophila SB210]EAR92781.1 hypothetical protein TTHERM_00324380 [Tetrahymena thermophila SB210]|eukprot:XP_001013026.1 hypothetical protein TTHERM_00324380 [Tetrahymena thermophila SB210]
MNVRFRRMKILLKQIIFKPVFDELQQDQKLIQMGVYGLLLQKIQIYFSKYHIWKQIY